MVTAYGVDSQGLINRPDQRASQAGHYSVCWDLSEREHQAIGKRSRAPGESPLAVTSSPAVRDRTPAS